MTSFMKHTDYVSIIDTESVPEFYNPYLDPLGPFFLFPKNCFGKKLGTYSPLIAYVDTGDS